MSNAAHILPARLRAAANALAKRQDLDVFQAGEPDVLDRLRPTRFRQFVEDARAVLDAADAVSPEVAPPDGDLAARRIHLAATVGLDLGAQAVVVFDVAQDGTVTVSTWSRRAGTAAEAIAAWADGLWRTAIGVVPFQTVFGWGRGGRPTPLTEAQRARLGPEGQAYADRNTLDPEEAAPRPLEPGDAESLCRALGGGALTIVHLDPASRVSAVRWASGAGGAVAHPGLAARFWKALAIVQRAFPADPPPAPDHPETAP